MITGFGFDGNLDVRGVEAGRLYPSCSLMVWIFSSDFGSDSVDDTADVCVVEVGR